MFKKRKARKAVDAVFEALPGEAAAFAADARIDAERPIGAWKALLAPVADADRLRDEQARVVAWGGQHLADVDIDELDVRKLHRGVNDQLRGFVVPLLDVLELESGPDAPLKLALDMRGLTPDKAGQPTDIPPPHGRYPKVRVTMTVDRWCAGSLRLGDGSTLAFRGIDRVRERHVTKQNPRGKIKSKTKWKTWAHHEVTLTAAADEYGWAATLPTPPEGVRIRSRETDRRRVVRLRETSPSTTKGSEPDVSWFLGMVGLAYEHLAPVSVEV